VASLSPGVFSGSGRPIRAAHPATRWLAPILLLAIRSLARFPPDSLRPPATRGTGVHQLYLLPISAKREREQKHVELIAYDQTSEFRIGFRACDFSRRVFLPTGHRFSEFAAAPQFFDTVLP
jgi:hypothetical protein